MITYPAKDANVANWWGTVWIMGTASIENFQFYKVEIGWGEAPVEWFSIDDVHRRPVVNDVLEVWNSGAFPEGIYQLRLTVVDNTGNYPLPCQVRVVIDR